MGLYERIDFPRRAAYGGSWIYAIDSGWLHASASIRFDPNQDYFESFGFRCVATDK